MSERAKLLGENGMEKKELGSKKWMRGEHNERVHGLSDEVVESLEDYIW